MKKRADVRSLSGTPVAVDFHNDEGTPIVIDRTQGAERLYILNDAGEVIELMTSVPFELRVPAGEVPGTLAVNKFGHAPSGAQTTATDVWDRADATPTQQIWVAPTQARVHAIVSTDDTDGKTGAPSSVGARTLRLWGLTDWDTAEVSEDITLDGTTSVNTVNSYVIVHRMKVLTSGTTNINVGTISATAATDGTVTAAIRPGVGQTQMAVYGVPSIQTFYMSQMMASINNTTAQTRLDVELKINESPDVSPLNVNFLIKDQVEVQNSGSSFVLRPYAPYQAISGPAIMKIQVFSSTADLDAFAQFDGYLVTN